MRRGQRDTLGGSCFALAIAGGCAGAPSFATCCGTHPLTGSDTQTRCHRYFSMERFVRSHAMTQPWWQPPVCWSATMAMQLVLPSGAQVVLGLWNLSCSRPGWVTVSLLLCVSERAASTCGGADDLQCAAPKRAVTTFETETVTVVAQPSASCPQHRSFSSSKLPAAAFIGPGQLTCSTCCDDTLSPPTQELPTSGVWDRL